MMSEPPNHSCATRLERCAEESSANERPAQEYPGGFGGESFIDVANEPRESGGFYDFFPPDSKLRNEKISAENSVANCVALDPPQAQTAPLRPTSTNETLHHTGESTLFLPVFHAIRKGDDCGDEGDEGWWTPSSSYTAAGPANTRHSAVLPATVPPASEALLLEFNDLSQAIKVSLARMEEIGDLLAGVQLGQSLPDTSPATHKSCSPIYPFLPAIDPEINAIKSLNQLLSHKGCKSSNAKVAMEQAKWESFAVARQAISHWQDLVRSANTIQSPSNSAKDRFIGEDDIIFPATSPKEVGDELALHATHPPQRRPQEQTIEEVTRSEGERREEAGERVEKEDGKEGEAMEGHVARDMDSLAPLPRPLTSSMDWDSCYSGVLRAESAPTGGALHQSTLSPRRETQARRAESWRCGVCRWENDFPSSKCYACKVPKHTPRTPSSHNLARSRLSRLESGERRKGSDWSLTDLMGAFLHIDFQQQASSRSSERQARKASHALHCDYELEDGEYLGVGWTRE